MKKLLLFSVLFFLLCKLSIVQSQTQTIIDSLLTELSKEKVDTSKINLLNSLGRSYGIASEFEKGLEYCNRALSLSEKLDFKKGIGNAHHIMGMISNRQGNYNETLKHYEIAIEIRERLNDKKGLAGTFNNIGTVFQEQGNYKEALKMLYRALKINEAIGNKEWQAANYNNIGIIYIIQKKYPEALKNLNAAIKIYEQTGNPFDLNHPYNNMGIIYLEQGKYPEALKAFETSYAIRLEMGDKAEIAEILGNLATVFDRMNRDSEAIEKFTAAFNISIEIGDKWGIANGYNNLGGVYLKNKDFKQASSYFEKGLALSKELGSLETLKLLHASLAELDSLTGDYKSSLKNYNMYIFYKDSIFNEENTEQLVQQQMQYDFDKKEAVSKAEQDKKEALALKELQRQKLVKNGFIGGFVTVLFFAGIFFAQRNKIKKGKKRSDELLLNILPSEVAEELKVTGASKAKDFDEVTVLFTDFKNFTAMSEKLSAQELVNEINYCYSAFDNIITRHGIEKIKTIGDSYMCAGGLPVANATNAIDTVTAALEIRDFMLDEKQKRQTLDKPFFEIRIGCNTGPVVAGIVGVKKFAYDIWGDTVNIASRMESSGEAGKINISGSTYELVKTKFHCEYRGKITAKNKGEIDMYFVSELRV